MSLQPPWSTALLVAIPFAVVAVGLAVASKLVDDYWASFDLVVYAALVAGAGGVAVLGCLAWFAVSNGWRPSSVAPALVVVVVAGSGTLWWFRGHRSDRACARAHRFYEELAAASPAERREMLRDAGTALTDPDACALEGLTTWFGPHPVPIPGDPRTEEDRLAALRELLAAGLPPTDDVIDAMVGFRDVAGVRVVLETRVVAGGSFPLAVFTTLARRAYCEEGGAGAETTEGDRRVRELLAAFLEVGRPRPEELGGTTLEKLRCLGLADPPGQ